MKKIINTSIGFLFALAFATNCSLTTKFIPNQPIQLKNVAYDVVGVTSAEACQQWILQIFPLGGSTEYAFTQGVNGGVDSVALFAAQNKLQQADALISPKFDYTITDYIVWSEKCSKVTAKGIIYK